MVVDEVSIIVELTLIGRENGNTDGKRWHILALSKSAFSHDTSDQEHDGHRHGEEKRVLSYDDVHWLSPEAW